MQARRAQAEKAVSPEARAPEADALVLTPALRVHEGGRFAPESPAAEAEPAAADSVEEAPYEEAVDELSAAEPLALAEVIQAAAPDEAEVEELEAPASEPETLEAKIAALEALISGDSDTPEKAEIAVHEETAPDAAQIAEADPEDPAEEALAWEDHQPEAEPEAAQATTVAEPSAEEAPAEDEIAEDAAPAADPFVFVHRNHPSGPEAPAGVAPEKPAAADETDTPIAAGTDGAVIDEEALRDMVVDIVREELQGALGERITRNVRRLVRREIHRALASQELD